MFLGIIGKRGIPTIELPFQTLTGQPSFPTERPQVKVHADDDKLIVTVYRGQCPTGGYEITVVAVRVRSGRLEVTCQLSHPAPGAMVTMALTFPHAAIAVPIAPLATMGVSEVWAVSEDGKLMAKTTLG